MAPPSTDFTNEKDNIRRPKKRTLFKFPVPLIYAPALPLIRLSLRKKPVLRDRLFTLVLASAVIHGGYLVSDYGNESSKMIVKMFMSLVAQDRL